jgi:hypothetical protein
VDDPSLTEDDFKNGRTTVVRYYYYSNSEVHPDKGEEVIRREFTSYEAYQNWKTKYYDNTDERKSDEKPKDEEEKKE